MATQQDEGGVPLSIAHEMQQFRLFELPPEIVELIDAPNPPLLSIKSQAPSNAPGAKPAYAVLCTPNKSYHLRQVQTSNSLFITKPALEAQGNEIPIPVTRAIASCTATLELSSSDASAATLLQEILPVFDIVAGEADATGNGKDKATIFDDIPLSEAQCQAGWNEVLAFMHDGSSYRPSPVALSCIWKSISAFALAENLRLDKQFLTSDVSRAVAEEGYPEGLAEVVLRYLCTDDEDTNGPWSCLDGTKAIAFTGRTLLEAKTGSDYLIAEFTDAWVDQLPEIWRQDAKLAAIEDITDFPTDTTVRAKSKGPASNTNSAASGPSAKPSARKWHEKFGKTRKK